MTKTEDRFKKTYSQGSRENELTEIWIDKQTGVNYLYHGNTFSGGLTPLLDENGKPIITPI